ncbi:MAG: amino acid-binding protein [Coriobacteriia bacterium]|nr:amino acid-binding protein [Coriobacteriia bacterium]MCL2536986.1 amino acid-binding protein [Coriobacteriia bacterium]
MAQQLSVFLENAPGRLNEMARVLGETQVNMHALFVADTNDFGVARIICDRTEDAAAALRDAGFSVTTTDVVAVEIPDTPGALGKLFEAIAAAEVDISYCYCVVDPTTKKAVSFCRFKTPNAQAVIEEAGFRIFGDNVFHS